MDRHLEYPLLRWPIDLRHQQFEGQGVLVLSCPLGITPRPLALVAAVAPILSCFRGELSISEIAAKFAAQGVPRELVEELAKLLDGNFFLAGPVFEAEKRRVEDNFRSSTLRVPALAGLGYSGEAASLAHELEGYLAAGPAAESARPAGRLLGVIAPHIDYRRGGAAYGRTYSRLRGADHGLYVLLGTAHQYNRHTFHLTDKDFQTPLGVLECDKDFVRKLAGLHGPKRSFAGEFLHHREHSLELQTPFLKYLSPAAKIVPILVGGFPTGDKPPEQHEEYNSFIEALTKCVRERLAQGEQIGFIAGIDLAHVGRMYGDNGQLTPEQMVAVERRDRILLGAIEEQNRHKLLAHIKEDDDARRICGFPTTYALLDIFDRLALRCEAELFDYRQAVDYEADCAVTFCGMGVYQSAAEPA